MTKKDIKTMNNELAQNYQKKNPREHCLDAPDTYIGSIEKDDNKKLDFRCVIV